MSGISVYTKCLRFYLCVSSCGSTIDINEAVGCVSSETLNVEWRDTFANLLGPYSFTGELLEHFKEKSTKS